MGAHNPAAAQLACGPVKITLAEGQAGEDALGLGFQGVAAQGGKLTHGFVVGVALRIASGLALGDDAPPLRELRGGGRGEFEDALLCHGRGLLREVADGGVALAAHAAGIGLDLAENDGEEGGFARAVGADKGDAVGALDLCADVLKKDLRPVGFGDAVDGDHVVVECRRRWCGSSWRGVGSGCFFIAAWAGGRGLE